MNLSKRARLVALFSALSLFCNLFNARLSAQDSLSLAFGKFKLEDLQMRRWASDTSATAAVLGEVGKLTMVDGDSRDGFILNVHRRVKIFTQAGFEHADITIPYYTKNALQRVRNVKAHTILPNGRIVAVENKAIVYEKINENVSIVKIIFPEITEGCIIEYTYDVDSEGGTFDLESWSFQDDIPTRMSVFYVNILNRYNYVTLMQGSSKITVIEKNAAGSEAHYHKTYYAHHLPAIKKEPFVTSISNHLVKVRFQLSSYFSRNGYNQKIFESWEKTASDLAKDETFGNAFLRKSTYDEAWEAAKSSIDPSDSVRAKVLKLYNWVNSNIEAEERGNMYNVKKPNETYKQRRGKISDLNFLLHALLREAGIDANMLLISTRDHGLHFIDYPILDQFNHAMVHVALPDSSFLVLDAGYKNLAMGLPHESSLNRAGWLLRKKGQQWILLDETKSTKSVLAQFDLNTEGVLSGVVNASYGSYAGFHQREIFQGDTSGSNKTAWINKNYPDWKVQKITVDNLDAPEKNLKEKVELILENAVQINDDLYYLKPTLQSGWETNPFKTEERFYPVEMPYPINDQYSLVLKIPDGFDVVELPKNVVSKFNDTDCKFTYNAGREGNTIRVVARIQINRTVFTVEEYKDLRKFFGDIAAKLNELIVLKKKEN